MKTLYHITILLLAYLMTLALDSSAQLKSNSKIVSGLQSEIASKKLMAPYNDSSIFIYKDTIYTSKEDSINSLLKEKELNNVIITSTKKTLDIQVDKMIYHVSNDQDAAYSYIYEILKKVPGIYSDQNDQLLINGSQNFLILINGKKSSLMSGNLRDILQSFPASNVLDIEIFQNPPLRYASEGVSAIINLKLKTSNIAGYNGTLNLQVGTPLNTNSNLSLLVKTGIVSYSTQNGMNQRKNPSNTTDYILNNYLTNEKIVKMGRGQSLSNSKYTNHELTLEIDSLNLLSFNFSTNNDGGSNSYLNESNNFLINGPILNSFKTKSTGVNNTKNHQWGLDFETYIGKKKKNLFTLSYQALGTKDLNETKFEIIPEINTSKSINNTNNNGSFSEKTFQLNYNNPIGENSLDIGAKVIRRFNESNYYYKSLDFLSNNFIVDPLSTDEFSYTQNVYSAYGNYDLRFKNNMIILGGSLENVEVFGNYKTNGNNIYRNYFNIIPSVSLSKRIKKYNFKFGYSQKIERPSLYYLNPYINRTDPYLISYGNPNLNPSMTHSFSGSLGIFKSKFSLNIFLAHNITNNAIQSYNFIGTDKITHSTFGNVGYKTNTIMNFSYNVSVTRELRISINWTPSYIRYSSLINENKVLREGLLQNVSSNFYFKLPLSWRFTGNLNYFSNSVTVQGTNSSFITTSMNFIKEFGKKKKVDVTLSIINPHQKTRKYFSENFDPNFYYYNESITVIRQFMVRLNYRFGGFQGSVSKKKKGIYNTDLKSIE